MTRKGEHHTESTKQKLHDIFVGKPTGRRPSDKAIQALKQHSYDRLGTPLSNETKLKISISQKGHTMPEHVKQKLIEINSKPRTDIVKENISIAQKKRFENPEQRKRQNHYRGKTPSPEVRKKMSDSGKGRVVTQTTRDKIRASLLGIKRPDMGASRIGENNPSWKGGISFAPYCEKFTKEFKERVRVYFDYQCSECVTHQSALKKLLAIHHVDFNKDSCCSDTIPLFVPLCQSCHSKTNHNREYWIEHFTTMINTYYGGKCYLSRNEMSSMLPNITIASEG